VNDNHILVVEDEDALREIVCCMLEDRGYQTTAAPLAPKALEYLAADPEKHQLILSDIIMPEMNGLQFLERVRQLYPDLPVLMLSALQDVRIAMEAIRAGAYDYVVKPFERDQLFLAVDRALERRRLILENRRYQSHLEEMVRQRTEALESALRELERSYDFTLEALGNALDLKDSETQGHSKRVTAFTVAIARAMGVGPEELKTIARGAYLHDIGKMAVPDSILRKEGPLDPAERELMRTHCQRGHDILAHIGYLKEVSEIVLSHQEQYDGGGYPRGLRGSQIPLGARIFAVADTLDAMTSDRPYRKALTLDQARAEVQRVSGTQFDPAVVEAFMTIPDSVWNELRQGVGKGFTLAATGWEKALSIGS
jgi:putative nucleotidyltransferase with HDIG domain